jgi:hypothetical protein
VRVKRAESDDVMLPRPEKIAMGLGVGLLELVEGPTVSHAAIALREAFDQQRHDAEGDEGQQRDEGLCEARHRSGTPTHAGEGLDEPTRDASVGVASGSAISVPKIDC